MDIEAFLAAHRLPRSYVRAVEQVHIPLAASIYKKCVADRMMVIGICGAQGSGKSTMVLVVQSLLQDRGLSCVAMSLDDLYLTRAERKMLAKRVHPLLATRGVPGTHDIELGLETIRALRRAQLVPIPAFDKAIDDRRPKSDWPRVRGPAQVLLLEGWCVGARPQDEADLQAPQNDLEREHDADAVWRRYANEALRGPYRRLFDELDALVLLQAPGFEVVRRWRTEQERKLRERVSIGSPSRITRRVMSDEEIARFIAHYERLTRHILAEMPERADALVRLSEEREPLEFIVRGKLA